MNIKEIVLNESASIYDIIYIYIHRYHDDHYYYLVKIVLISKTMYLISYRYFQIFYRIVFFYLCVFVFVCLSFYSFYIFMYMYRWHTAWVHGLFHAQSAIFNPDSAFISQCVCVRCSNIVSIQHFNMPFAMSFMTHLLFCQKWILYLFFKTFVSYF